MIGPLEHLVVIISALNKALKQALSIATKISTPTDAKNDKEIHSLIKTTIGTRLVVRQSDLVCKLALQAVRTVSREEEDTSVKTVDLKQYAWIARAVGATIVNCIEDLHNADVGTKPDLFDIEKIADDE